MVKQITLILRFVVIGLIYVVLFKIIKVMYTDLKGSKKKDKFLDYALEVLDAPSESGISKGSVLTLHTITNIGRNQANNIIIEDPYVSSYHARIFIKDNELYIMDLNSTNGTIKNGDLLKEAEELYDGDIIEIGRVKFKVIG